MTHKFELLVQLLRTDFSKAVFALCHMPMGAGLRQEVVPHLGHSDTQVTDLMHLMYLLCDCDDTVNWQVVRRCRSHRLPLVRSVAYETSFRANPELEIECLRLYPIGPNQLKALARDIEVPASQRERAMTLLMLFHSNHCTLEELQQWSSRPLPHAQGTGFEVSSFAELLLKRRLGMPNGPGWHLANNVLRAFRE
jgi:hypothetical protein